MGWVDERRRFDGARRFTGWQAVGILVASMVVTFVLCWLGEKAIHVLQAMPRY